MSAQHHGIIINGTRTVGDGETGNGGPECGLYERAIPSKTSGGSNLSGWRDFVIGISGLTWRKVEREVR